MRNHVSAIFPSIEQAKTAIDSLGEAGVPLSAINYAGQEQAPSAVNDTTVITDGETAEEVREDTQEVAGSMLTGGAIGAILGVAALMIPVVGPAVATTLVATGGLAGAAATGAVLGAGVGAVAEGLEGRGYSTTEITYYEERMAKGGILLTVDTAAANLDPNLVAGVLKAAGGDIANSALVEETPATA